LRGSLFYFIFGISDLVYVEGQLRYSDYTDKEGTPRTKAEIYQCKLILLIILEPRTKTFFTFISRIQIIDPS
jgi:hypothetical protein